MYGKLAEGPVIAQKVDGMSCRRTEIGWKFKPMHGKLTTDPVDAPKVVGS